MNRVADPNRQWLSIGEAALVSGLSPSTLKRYESGGGIGIVLLMCLRS